MFQKAIDITNNMFINENNNLFKIEILYIIRNTYNIIFLLLLMLLIPKTLLL